MMLGIMTHFIMTEIQHLVDHFLNVMLSVVMLCVIRPVVLVPFCQVFCQPNLNLPQKCLQHFIFLVIQLCGWVWMCLWVRQGVYPRVDHLKGTLLG